MLNWTGGADAEPLDAGPPLLCVPGRDLIKRRYGRLTVDAGPVRNRGRLAWWCLCDCGTMKLIRQDDLRSGKTRSCGCGQRKRIAAIGRLNATHGGTRTRLYSIWHGMVQRCEYARHKGYPDYGGRGITVCAEWRRDFAAFRTWAEAHGYAADLTLDRRDPDGHYEPGNYRWASYAEQNANRRIFGPRLRAEKAPERKCAPS